jgi:hypothetical protein
VNIFERLQNIDRRVLYLLLFVVISLPLIVDVPVPKPAILPQTRDFYDTIERIAADPEKRGKLVIVSANFSSSTAAENLTQTETLLRHLMKRRLKFGILAFDAQGRELSQQIAEKIQGQYGYEYGRDYVNFGFRPFGAFVNTLKAMVRDIPTALGKDFKGADLKTMPVMKGIRGVDDTAAVIEITASRSLDAWIQFYQRTGKQPIPTLYCPTAVMAAEAFPLLKSGQLQGMLIGLKGAIEYEALLNERGFATRASASLSYSHFLILGLIVLGNVGMFATKARERARASASAGARGNR